MAIESVKKMVAAAKEQIDNISPTEAARRAKDEGALIVDIRDVREMQRDGAIPGAMHAPRGMLEFWVSPDSPYTKEIFSEDREFVLCCAGGGSSPGEWQGAFARAHSPAALLARRRWARPHYARLAGGDQGVVVGKRQ